MLLLLLLPVSLAFRTLLRLLHRSPQRLPPSRRFSPHSRPLARELCPLGERVGAPPVPGSLRLSLLPPRPRPPAARPRAQDLASV
eukprot:3258070-Rhodomonas_salina.3